MHYSRFHTSRMRLSWAAAFTASLLLALVVSSLASARAQEPSPATQNGNTSNIPLAQQNLERVAASLEEIRAVLSKDPGLMVELKRWVAIQASNMGQVLTDNDLSDQAIYDRLGTDAEFRAVATRLLQRYGYLLPKTNPDSELAKERALVLQERAIQLARMQEQQRTGQPNVEQTAQGQTLGCDPRSARNCPGTRGPAPQGSPSIYNTIPAGPGLPALPQEPLPLTPLGPGRESLAALSPSLQTASQTGATGLASLRAQLGGSGTDSEESGIGLGASRTLSGQLSSSLAAGAAGGSLISGLSPFDEAEQYPEVAELRSRGAQQSQLLPSAAPRPPLAGSMQKPIREEPAALVASPNPYAGIPSLYSMYMQAAPQTGQPERFGMEVFRDTSAMTQRLPMDLPVGPSYVVGPGDGLTISLWGSASTRFFRVVDRSGRLNLPEVGPLLVSGRTLGEVQQAVQQVLRTQFRDVSADVSLSWLRTVRVYVVGDVVHPGAYDISSLSTPLNALFAAGGPTAIGSLRLVEHYRGKQLLETVDVYDLLLHGVREGIDRLEDGDTVLVPPLGPEVTVQGMVRRPAVYEMHGEKDLAQVLELAGGILPAAALRHIEVERLVVHEKRTMLSLDIPETESPAAAEKQLASFAIQNGDTVRVFPVAPYNQDAIYLEGHVLRPGKYAYHPGMKLTDLVSSYKDLLPEPATSYAEIIRLNPPDYRPSVESFNLGKALANSAAAPKLEPLDTVRVFGRYDFEDLPTVLVGGDVRRPGLYRTAGQIHLSDAIKLAGGLAPDADTSSAQVFRVLPNGRLKVTSVNLGEALAGDPLDNLLLGPRDQVVVHRSLAQSDPPTVSVRGDVAHPGRYPLGTNMRVSDLVRLAGGLKRSADTTAADLTRYLPGNSTPLVGEQQQIELAKAFEGDSTQNPVLRNGDVLTIRQVPGWKDIGASVTVAGEVRHPGVYGIRPGERLSSVLERAGGFLPTAYPQGIVFDRAEVRRLQQESRQELIQRLRQQASSFKTSLQSNAAEQAQLQQAAFAQSERAITALEQAPISGRLVIRMRANLARFRNTPDDIELRASDYILIPKESQFVIVTGQVYNSNAITYHPQRNAGWYLRQAGGPTSLANKKGIFIVRANGAVTSGKGGGLWDGSVLSAQIEPGDTIVVPERAIGGSSVWRNLLSVAQLAQSAAIVSAVAVP